MGMPPACSEVLFNHLCQNGLLPFAMLARCSAVSHHWKEDLTMALPTARALDFRPYGHRVKSADVLRALTRVAGENLRLVDLRGLRRVRTRSEENIVGVIRQSCPGVKDILQDKRISIIVRKHNGGDNLFRIRETTSVGKLMKTFCLACSHDMDSLRFIFNGARLRSTQTLQELDMADGDVVTAMFFMGGGPAEGAYMENHVVSSIPSGGTVGVPVDTAISVTFRASEEPAAIYPSRREITLAAFLDPTAPCRVGNPLQNEFGVVEYPEGRGHVAPWTDHVLGNKFHVVVMDPADAGRVGGDLEYHCTRNNQTYYGGDEHSWQRYTTQMPLAGALAVDEVRREIHFTPAAPLRPGQMYGIVLQHYAMCLPGCHSDVVIPFTTQN